MINTQLKFEGKISTVQKLLYSLGITQNFIVLKPIDLEGQGQGHQFSNPSETYLIPDKQFKLEGKICSGSKFNS